MKSVKQVVAVLVWCAVSVGCVAEGKEPPTVSKSPAEQSHVSNQSDAMSSDVDEIIITTHVDPETGSEYQELNATFTINKFNYYPRSSLIHVIAINDFYIERITGGEKFISGKIIFPSDIEYGHWNNIINRRATVFCKIIPNVNDKLFCRQGCDKESEMKFSFKRFCTLSGNENYYIEVK